MAKLSFKQGTVATALVIDNMDESFSNHEIGITFYSDSDLTTVVDSGMTGTYGLTAVPAVNQYDQDVSGATAIDVSVASQFEPPVTIATSVKKITATPTSITGATHWQMIVRSEL